MSFPNFMCCAEDAQHLEDRREIVLLQDAGADFLPTLDGSDHWKPDDLAVADTSVEETPFVFGGAASSWLSSEPVVFSDSNPDSILACDDEEGDAPLGEAEDTGGFLSASSDATFVQSSEQASGDDSNLTAEQEINEMIQSPTDPVGKVCSAPYSIQMRAAIVLQCISAIFAVPSPARDHGPTSC